MRFFEFVRLGLFCGLATLLFSVGAASTTVNPAPSPAAELIMVESGDCPYCDRFHAEIGQVYPNTDEGKIAPLRTWQLGTPFPDTFQLSEPVRFTPTFVLFENGIEVDRLVGYTGDEFFWFLLGEMLEKLKK